MTTQELHSEPQVRVGGGWISALVLANLGLFMAFLTPIQVLLAEQIDELSPSGKEVALGWATGVGALVAVVANPLAGALSDRTGGRFGRRRPWILGGAVWAPWDWRSPPRRRPSSGWRSAGVWRSSG